VGDRQNEAAFIAHELARRFGADNVFFANRSIQPGEDFAHAIQAALRRCTVLLAVIGPGWLEAKDAAHRRRIDRDDDWVRLELREAFRLGLRVIPLLVVGDRELRLPRADELPDDIAALSRCQFIRMRYQNLNLDLLIDQLAGLDSKLAPGTRVPFHQVGTVPRLADCFQSRQVGKDLETAIARDHAGTSTWILSGLGGVGKTQLAAHLARRMGDAGDLDLLVWAAAPTRQAVLAAYTQAGADVGAGEGIDAEQTAARFLGWLERTDQRWLIVLDDVANPADLRGLWPPATTTARVVVATTRRRDAAFGGSDRTLINVGLFTGRDSMSYLATKLGDKLGRPDDAASLADDVGHLPLALAQAAAYMLDRGLDCAEYRRRFTDRRRRLADLLPEDGALPDDQLATVAVTWSLSAEFADGLQPTGLSGPSLRLASMLDASGIPEEVLTGATATAYLARCRPEGNPPTPADAADALHCLHRLNLVHLDDPGGRGTVNIHALVQRAIREQLSQGELDLAVRSAVAAVLENWPAGEPRDRASSNRCARLLPHADAVLGYANSLGVESDDVALLNGRVAGHLWLRGERILATSLLERVLDHCRRTLGDSHPDTLTTRHDLARLAREQHRFDLAERELRSVLGARSRILGDDHQRTLDTRHELALVLLATGRVELAERELQRVFETRRRMLGDDHPHTLGARYNLAYLRHGRDRKEDERQFSALLDAHRRVLGDEHVATLNVRQELAQVLTEQGRTGQAEAELRSVLELRQQILGEDHIDTINGRLELARVLYETGSTQEATHHLRAVIAAREQVLGDGHPDTAAVRSTLTLWQRSPS
jgi:tetratricopeptide (TPR) repeat protein